MIIAWLILSLLFGLAYTQSHLYNDNQNTKFLHGLAQSGINTLSEDWLANTVDPLPVFSFMVQVTNWVSPQLFYIYFILLMGVYIFSLLGICAELFQIDRAPHTLLLVFTILLVLHAMQTNLWVARWLGIELELLHFGVAGQYLLGLDFQNSSFGVLILLSFFTFLRRRLVWAVLYLAIATWFHPAYLFSAAFLTLAYISIMLWNEFKVRTFSLDNWFSMIKKPFMLGFSMLIMVLPVVLHNQIVLNSSSPQLTEEALRILVHERIPHHALIETWFDWGAVMQLSMILIALLLTWRTQLFPIMFFPFIGGVAVSMIQVATRNDSLALMAPWRVSVVLVPLALAILVARLVVFAEKYGLGRTRVLPVIVSITCVVVVIWMVWQGVRIQTMRNQRYNTQRTLKMMNFVRTSRGPGQVYLVPPRDNRFDEFRIYTGVPIFINWKSHPYRDEEVLEWYYRNRLAESFFASEGQAACAILKDIGSQYRITHVVFDLSRPAPVCPDLDEIYRDKRYAVARYVTP